MTLMTEDEMREALRKAGWKEFKLGWRGPNKEEYGVGYYKLRAAYKLLENARRNK